MGKKNPQKSFELIKKGISILESSQSRDYKLWNVYTNAIFSLSLFYYNEEIMRYVIDKIKLNYINIRRSTKYKTLCNLIQNKYEFIKNSNKKELLIYIVDYKELINSLEDDSLGIIIYMNNGYGFIANKNYSNNIYFNYNNNDFFDIGSIVSFDIKTTSDDKVLAVNIKEKSKIEESWDYKNIGK